jgi:hypothetical protein
VSEDKICRGCDALRKREEFALKNAATGERHSQCKECGRRRAKDHYLANHAAYIERNRRNRPTQRRRNANIVLDYLLTHSCVQCGECDPVVLEFNHVDVRAKTGNVAELVRSGCSRKRLLDEIMKCEVLCANCHQRYTSSSRTAHYRRPTGSISNPRVPNFRVAANARNHKVVLQVLSNAR